MIGLFIDLLLSFGALMLFYLAVLGPVVWYIHKKGWLK